MANVPSITSSQFGNTKDLHLTASKSVQPNRTPQPFKLDSRNPESSNAVAQLVLPSLNSLPSDQLPSARKSARKASSRGSPTSAYNKIGVPKRNVMKKVVNLTKT